MKLISHLCLLPCFRMSGLLPPLSRVCVCVCVCLACMGTFCFVILYCGLSWCWFYICYLCYLEILGKEHCPILIYLFIYSPGCIMFPHLPPPILQLSSSSIFLCNSSLLPLITFPPISPLIPSDHVSLGLPRFLLPGGLHFITSFGNLPYSILWTCPYHWSYLVSVSSKRDLTTVIFCLIMVFLILFNNSVPNFV